MLRIGNRIRDTTLRAHGHRPAAKRVKGGKRHIVTDTAGSLLAVLVHAANIQDNHGAVPLLRSLGRRFPKLRHIFADRVYRGQKLLNALADSGKWTIEIITRSQSVGTFKPPRTTRLAPQDDGRPSNHHALTAKPPFL